MNVEAISLSEKLSLFDDQWAPKIIARLNDYDLKLAKIQGDFVWHSHPETDEVFLVLDGSMVIDFREGNVHLAQGELCVVPRGVEHKPHADDECHVLLIEPAGTKNTGDAGGERAAEGEVWI